MELDWERPRIEDDSSDIIPSNTNIQAPRGEQPPAGMQPDPAAAQRPRPLVVNGRELPPAAPPVACPTGIVDSSADYDVLWRHYPANHGQEDKQYEAIVWTAQDINKEIYAGDFYHNLRGCRFRLERARVGRDIEGLLEMLPAAAAPPPAPPLPPRPLVVNRREVPPAASPVAFSIGTMYSSADYWGVLRRQYPADNRQEFNLHEPIVITDQDIDKGLNAVYVPYGLRGCRFRFERATLERDVNGLDEMFPPAAAPAPPSPPPLLLHGFGSAVSGVNGIDDERMISRVGVHGTLAAGSCIGYRLPVNTPIGNSATTHMIGSSATTHRSEAQSTPPQW
jgi:hypothetical protein